MLLQIRGVMGIIQVFETGIKGFVPESRKTVDPQSIRVLLQSAVDRGQIQLFHHISQSGPLSTDTQFAGCQTGQVGKHRQQHHGQRRNIQITTPLSGKEHQNRQRHDHPAQNQIDAGLGVSILMNTVSGTDPEHEQGRQTDPLETIEKPIIETFALQRLIGLDPYRDEREYENQVSNAPSWQGCLKKNT